MVSLCTSYAVRLKTQLGIFLELNWRRRRWSTFALTGWPRIFFTTQSYQRDYWKKGYVELMLLGNHYSKIDTIRHKSINNCNAPETVDCWFLFLAKPITFLSVAFKKIQPWYGDSHQNTALSLKDVYDLLKFCTLHILHLCFYKTRKKKPLCC